MVKKCYVCSRRVCKINQISVHSFPKDLDLRQKWLNALNLTNKDDVSCTYVCSLHFTAEDIERGSDLSKSRLKKGAIPSVNISNPNGYNNRENGYDMYNTDMDYPFMPEFNVLAQLSESMYTNDNSYVDEGLMPVSNVQCDFSFNDEPNKEVEQLNCQPDIPQLECQPDIEQLACQPDIEQLDCQPDVEQLACQPDLPDVSHIKAENNLNKRQYDVKDNEAGFAGFENTYPSMTVSPEEYNYYETLFSDIDSVKYKKLHCTACNVHMGTAPIAHIHRYEHPLLKVLICEQCFNFYSSGDFEKDADGSELYCRWCGQGGQVYCCAKCPFVFCKKCIRRNIGQSMVTHIESSDDWLCYACDPKAIWMLRGLNWALKKYSSSKMSIGASTRTEQDNKDIITDYSMCCKDRAAQQNKGAKITVQNKRNSVSSNHSDSSQGKVQVKPQTQTKTPIQVKTPKVSLERLKVPHDKQTGIIINNTKSPNAEVYKSNISKPRLLLPKSNSNSTKDEVVCTPDIISLDDDSPPATPVKFNKPKPEPPKKFLQVKPASKLLDPVKNDSKTYKTIQYSTSLVSSPVNLQTLQNNPVVSGMIQNLQKHLRPGEPQKIIKIVSPDGRAFLIDPMKVPNSPTGQPTIVAAPETMPPSVMNTVNSTPPPLHVLKQNISNAMPVQRLPIQRTKLWFDTSINGLRNISQMISTMIVSLVNDQKSLTNWVSLYNNFQTHLKTLSDNVENLKLQIRNEYLQTVHVDPKKQIKPQQVKAKNDYGQHFLSFVEENHPHLDPQLLTAASQAAMNPGVILLNAQQPTLIPLSNNPLVNLENVPIGANTNILKSMLNKPENGNNEEEGDQDIPDDVMFDPKDLLEQTLEVGEGTVGEGTVGEENEPPKVVAEEEKEESGDEEVDEEKIKKLKEHLAEIQKEIAKRKTENHKRKSEKKTDDIFDMDVTCDSDDESVHSLLSIKSSDSDSDCVVVDNENKKRKVKRKKTSSLNHSEAENSETIKIESSSDDLNSTIESNENSKKRKFDELEDDKTESKVEVVAKKPKIDENGENVETGNDKSENHKESNETEDKLDESSENTGKSPEKKNEEVENESSSEKSDKENIESSEKTAPVDEFNPNDLVSIANAIRESIRESRNLTKPLKPKAKVGDVEQLLSSNVVFKKSENENGETSSTNSKSAEKAPGNSYGDAFSNFLASSADNECGELEDEPDDAQPSDNLDLPDSNNLEQQSENVELPDNNKLEKQSDDLSLPADNNLKQSSGDLDLHDDNNLKHPSNVLDLPDSNNLEHPSNDLNLTDGNNFEQSSNDFSLPDGNNLDCSNLQDDSINSNKNNTNETKGIDEINLDELQRITENIIANVTNDI